MEFRLKIILLLVLIIFLGIVVNSIRKDNMSLKYSLIWLISTLLMIIIILIPNFLEFISELLGFELVSNMIFMIAIIILLVISFIFTIIVSNQTEKIRLLIQEISILKAEVKKLENKK